MCTKHDSHHGKFEIVQVSGGLSVSIPVDIVQELRIDLVWFLLGSPALPTLGIATFAL